MASATDNVYVNIIANTQGFTDKMKSAMKPLRDFMQVIQGIMAMGGAAMVINKIAQAVGDMEKAYAKMYPESQRAVGSIASWNETMTNMKAQQGAIVSSILTPIRAAFQNIIDPVGSATYELRQLQKVMGEISDKYLTTDRKAYKDREDALKRLAEATKTWSNAVANQSRLESELAQKQKEYLKAQELAKLATGTGGRVAIDTTTAQNSLRAAQAAVDANRRLISESLVAQRNINEWLETQNETRKDGAGVTKEMSDAEKLMLQYLKDNVGVQAQRLELAQEYMDVMDQIYQQEGEAAGPSRGSKGGKKTASKKTIGRRATEETEEATEAAVELNEEYQKYADLLVTISASLGEAFATGDYITAIKQMTAALLDFIAKEAIAAGLKMILAGNIPMGIALLAIGGITLGVSAGARAGGGGGGGGEGVSFPRMAAGGVVTRPTLAMIGEAGPEAVVPLGKGMGGTTIIVHGSIWQTEDLARAVAGAQARW